ncbi:MAG: S16 family serine protease [Bowdeniella nasicola]|nr:S16 family serine protease [Bowdeniella nasicola]
MSALATRYRWARLITGISALACCVAPLPYVIEHPGPTIDVLGDYQDEELITVNDPKDTGGPLRMTTVTISGLPGDVIMAYPLTRAFFTSTDAITPRELIFPEGQTAEENREISRAQMNSSQESASVAALEAMGRTVVVSLEIAGIAEGASAADVVDIGDILLSVTPPGGTPVAGTSYRDIIQTMATIPPATEVDIVVERDGQRLPLTVTTIEPPTLPDGTPERQGSLLGLALYAHPDSDLGVDFGVGDRIGGPSAGLMFSLGIIDKLTPGPLTGTHDVAGTGTISLDGSVGPIGGIAQKLAGAKRDGAEYFLIPAANCADAEGHVPDGLAGVRVETLADALDAVKAIAADRATALPTCD